MARYALRVTRFRATAHSYTSVRRIRGGDRPEQARPQRGVVLDVATAVARTVRSAIRSIPVVVVKRPQRRHWVCHFTPTILSRCFATGCHQWGAVGGFCAALTAGWGDGYARTYSRYVPVRENCFPRSCAVIMRV